MSVQRFSDVMAYLSWVLAGAIILRPELGLLSLFPDDEHAAQLGPIALFIVLLGLVVMVGGALAGLRERVERLEALMEEIHDERQITPQ